MSQFDLSEILQSDQPVIVAPTAVRRSMGVFALWALGALLLLIVVAAPPEGVMGKLVLLGFGLGALALGEATRRATAHHVMLTPEGLSDSAGRVLCRMEEIAAVERGVFAFKPSNGFLVRTHGRQKRAWAPGLWWRFGKKIGIGGVTPASQAKFMAEMLSARLAAQAAQDD